MHQTIFPFSNRQITLHTRTVRRTSDDVQNRGAERTHGEHLSDSDHANSFLSFMHDLIRTRSRVNAKPILIRPSIHFEGERAVRSCQRRLRHSHQAGCLHSILISQTTASTRGLNPTTHTHDWMWALPPSQVQTRWTLLHRFSRFKSLHSSLLAAFPGSTALNIPTCIPSGSHSYNPYARPH